MRVKIREDAAAAYVRRCYAHAHPQCGRLHSPEFADMLRAVQGQWLEVETDWLFRDQFNTVPIPGVTENGLRVMVSDIDEVEDDVRPGRVFDSRTHRNYAIADVPEECFSTPERQSCLKVWRPEQGCRMVMREVPLPARKEETA